MEVFLKLEKALGKRPMQEGEVKKKKKKVKVVDPMVPSFDILGSEFDSTQETTQGSQEPAPETTTILTCVRRSPRIVLASGSGTKNDSPVVSVVPVNEKDCSSIQPSPSPVASGSRTKDTTLISVPIVDDVVIPNLEDSTKDTSPQEVDIEENIKMKRNVVRSNVYRSPFLQRNIDILSDLTKLEKSVIDYALLDNSDERFVFSYFTVICITI